MDGDESATAKHRAKTSGGEEDDARGRNAGPPRGLDPDARPLCTRTHSHSHTLKLNLLLILLLTHKVKLTNRHNVDKLALIPYLSLQVRLPLINPVSATIISFDVMDRKSGEMERVEKG